ncbi:hypothetical protein ACLRGH_08425 [Arthrobacter koreensis]|uniref:hypothetical protein n=1 Tax=Arthrobacter koreensis TaxID=199136 RepID=UPI003AD291BD
MQQAPQLLLSLPDVATLAKVRRPAVSMWRTRLRTSGQPFPSPVRTENGQELFDAGQVAEWLVTTGHGKNPDALADLGAFAAMSGVSINQEDVFAALTALLTLRSLTGQPLSGRDTAELLDMADDEDPDDDLLYSELESVKPDLENLARYTDLLAEGAFNPAAAFEKLMADRFRHHRRKYSGTALTQPAMDLVAAVAIELASGLSEAPVFADPSSGGSDLLLALASALGDGSEATLMTGSGHDETARLARRRLRIHGIPQGKLDIAESGEFALHGPAVHVAHYPSPGAASMDSLDILTAIDHSVLQMDDQQCGLVIAPDMALNGVLPQGTARNIRSSLIREGRVRAIVRLPKGLLRSKPRQIMAMWVLGPAHPDVPIPERWVMLADLTGEHLDSGVIQDLVGDLSASMGTLAQIRAHSFRFATRVPSRIILPGDSPLTASARPARSAPVPRGAESALAADRILERLSTDGPTSLRYSVEPTEHAETSLSIQTLESLLKQRVLRYVPGSRLDGSILDPNGGVPVYGVGEVLGETTRGGRRVHLADYAATYPRGGLTEPGDVVFCTGPRAAAFVDNEGTAVVAYPARILRVQNRQAALGLIPQLLAADVNRQAGNRGPWRRWPVRLIQHHSQELAPFLAEIETQRAAARARLEQLEELTTLVLDGVAGGTLTVTDTYAAMEGNS